MTARKFRVGDVVRINAPGSLSYHDKLGTITDDDGDPEDCAPYLVDDGMRWDADSLTSLPTAFEKFQTYVNANWYAVDDLPGEVEDIASEVFGVEIEAAEGFKFTPIT